MSKKILILTAKFQPNDIEFGKSLGADAYITKPFDAGTLLAEIKRLLKT